MHLIANRKEEREGQQCRRLKHFSCPLLSVRIQIRAGRQWRKGIVLWIASLAPFHSQANPQPSSPLALRGGLSTQTSTVEQHIRLITQQEHTHGCNSSRQRETFVGLGKYYLRHSFWLLQSCSATSLTRLKFVSSIRLSRALSSKAATQALARNPSLHLMGGESVDHGALSAWSLHFC